MSALQCDYCGESLPELALFCGECGRSVAPEGKGAEFGFSSLPVQVEAAQDELVCAQCGTSMAADDIFCPECGQVSPSINTEIARPSDTNIIDPVKPEGLTVGSLSRESLESSADSAPHEQAESFVLQFSTGESFTVTGTGLIGRSPKPEPGEFFDRLVQIADPGRSVSKTHLEFGQESGRFWIKDRFSGNGTVFREPELKPIRCRPDHRYSISRGTRVDLGEQFFVVS